MIKYFFLIILIVFNAGEDDPNEIIRQRTELLLAGNEVEISGELILSKSMLPMFYQERGFELTWDKDDYEEILNLIAQSRANGLNPKDYHYSALQLLINQKRSPKIRADIDCLITDGLILLSSHYLNGKINPETVDPEWKAIRREGNASNFLLDALKNDNIEGAINSLVPSHAEYSGLSTALIQYEKIERDGGWNSVASGETLKPGMKDSVRIPQMIARLKKTNDLSSDYNADLSLYDSVVFVAVKKFQKRHGLEADGFCGKSTIDAMNISVGDKIDKIEANLERYRWISQDLGIHFVMVNIADFSMKVIREGQQTFKEKVIVGKTFRKTPVFSSKMTYLVINPYWTVPPTILFNDILPEVKKNTGYLATKNMKVFAAGKALSDPIDPNTIDWSVLSKSKFPYILRQEPGPTNALGAVKFMFPNTYNVYIHDTPSRELFNRPDRAFSSGCIRLNNPLDFTAYLLADQNKWDVKKLKEIVKDGKETTVMLNKPLNVHILYLTAWAENGEFHFRNDLYDRDKDVINSLNAIPPTL